MTTISETVVMKPSIEIQTMLLEMYPDEGPKEKEVYRLLADAGYEIKTKLGR